MKVLYENEHQDCFHLERGIRPTVEIRNLEKGQGDAITFRKNEIVFVTKGKIRLIFRGHPEKLLCEGEIIFIPLGGMTRYVVLESTQVTIIRPNGTIQLCEKCGIDDLYKSDDPVPEARRRKICTLEINQPIRYYLDGLNEAVQGGLTCRNYFDVKIRELFILLKSFYPREQLRDFFSLILSPTTLFSEHVRANYQHYKTVKELAQSMNMTPKMFSKKFIRIFGESAEDWMRREKALSIYSDLSAGDRTIAQIADKYRFSSQSYLNKFCIREFGKSPGKIRNWW